MKHLTKILFPLLGLVFLCPVYADMLRIPEKFGVVENKTEFENDNDAITIFLIKDAHNNYGAQKNIAKIINIIMDQYSTRDCTLGIEGAYGELDFSALRKFPIADARENASQNILKKGFITGAEHAAIISSVPYKIYGLENETLFRKNLDLFHYLVYSQKDSEQVFLELNSTLSKLSGKIFNPKLYRFYSFEEKFHKNQVDISEYINFAVDFEQNHAVFVKEYPQMNNFMKVVSLKALIDESKLEREIKILKNHLGMNGDYTEIASNTEELSILLQTAKKTKLSQKFSLGSIKLQKQFLEKLYSVNYDQLLAEVASFSTRVKEDLSQSPEETDLLEIQNSFSELNNIISLKLSSNEAIRLDSKTILERIKKSLDNLDLLADGIHSGAKVSALYPKLTDLFNKSVQFYECAQKRDFIMIQNLIAKMENAKTNKGIIVAGGFHWRGICDSLKTRKISFCVIKPNIEILDDSSGYMERVTGRLANSDSKLKTSLNDTLFNAVLKSILPGENIADSLLYQALGEKWESELISDLAFTFRAYLIKDMPGIDGDIRRRTESIYALKKEQFANRLSKSRANYEKIVEELRNISSKLKFNDKFFDFIDDITKEQFPALLVQQALDAFNIGGKITEFGYDQERSRSRGMPVFYFTTDKGSFVLKGYPEEFEKTLTARFTVINDLFGNALTHPDGSPVARKIFGSEKDFILRDISTNTIYIIQNDDKIADKNTYSPIDMYHLGLELGNFLNVQPQLYNKETTNRLSYDIISNLNAMREKLVGVYPESSGLPGVTEDYKIFLLHETVSVANQLAELGFESFKKGYVPLDLNRQSVRFKRENGKLNIDKISVSDVAFSQLAGSVVDTLINFADREPDTIPDDFLYSESALSLIKGFLEKQNLSREEIMTIPVIFKYRLISDLFEKLDNAVGGKVSFDELKSLYDQTIKYFEHDSNIDWQDKYYPLMKDALPLHANIPSYMVNFAQDTEAQKRVLGLLTPFEQEIRQQAKKLGKEISSVKINLDNGFDLKLVYLPENKKKSDMNDLIIYGWPKQLCEQRANISLPGLDNVQFIVTVYNGNLTAFQKETLSTGLSRQTGKNVLERNIESNQMRDLVDNILSGADSVLIYNPFDSFSRSVEPLSAIMSRLKMKKPAISFSMIGKDTELWEKSGIEPEINYFANLAALNQTINRHDFVVVPCFVDSQWPYVRSIILSLIPNYSTIIVPGRNMAVLRNEDNIEILSLKPENDVYFKDLNVESYTGYSLDPFFGKPSAVITQKVSFIRPDKKERNHQLKEQIKKITGFGLNDQVYGIYLDLFNRQSNGYDMPPEFWADYIIQCLKEIHTANICFSFSRPEENNRYQADYVKKLMDLVAEKLNDINMPVVARKNNYITGFGFMIAQSPESSMNEIIPQMYIHDLVVTADDTLSHFVSSFRGDIITLWQAEKNIPGSEYFFRDPKKFESSWEGALPVSVDNNNIETIGVQSKKLMNWTRFIHNFRAGDIASEHVYKYARFPWDTMYSAVYYMKSLEYTASIHKITRADIRTANYLLGNLYLAFNTYKLLLNDKELIANVTFLLGRINSAQSMLNKPAQVDLTQASNKLRDLVDEININPAYKYINLAFSMFSKANPYFDDYRIFREWNDSVVRNVMLEKKFNIKLMGLIDSFFYRNIGSQISKIKDVEITPETIVVYIKGKDMPVYLSVPSNLANLLRPHLTVLSLMEDMDKVSQLIKQVKYNKSPPSIKKLIAKALQDEVIVSIGENLKLCYALAENPHTPYDILQDLANLKGDQFIDLHKKLLKNPRFKTEFSIRYLELGDFVSKPTQMDMYLQLRETALDRLAQGKALGKIILEGFNGKAPSDNPISFFSFTESLYDNFGKKYNVRTLITDMLKKHYLITKGKIDPDTSAIDVLRRGKFDLIQLLLNMLDLKTQQEKKAFYDLFFNADNKINTEGLADFLKKRLPSKITKHFMNAFKDETPVNIKKFKKTCLVIIAKAADSINPVTAQKYRSVLITPVYGQTINPGQKQYIFLYRKSSRETILKDYGFSDQQKLVDLIKSKEILKDQMARYYEKRIPAGQSIEQFADTLSYDELIMFINSINEFLFNSVVVMGLNKDYIHNPESIKGRITSKLTPKVSSVDIDSRSDIESQIYARLDNSIHFSTTVDEVINDVFYLSQTDDLAFSQSAIACATINLASGIINGSSININFENGDIYIGDTLIRNFKLDEIQQLSINEIIERSLEDYLAGFDDSFEFRIETDHINKSEDGYNVDYNLYTTGPVTAVKIDGRFEIKINSQGFQSGIIFKPPVRAKTIHELKIEPDHIEAEIDRFTNLTKLDKEFVRSFFNLMRQQMPSIFQKAMYDPAHGFEHSYNLLIQVLDITEKVDIFRMGQAEETYLRVKLFIAAMLHDVMVLDYTNTQKHAITGSREAYYIIRNNAGLFSRFGDVNKLATDVIVMILRHDNLKSNVLLEDDFSLYTLDSGYKAEAINILRNQALDVEYDIASRLFFFADKMTSFDPVRHFVMPADDPRFDPLLTINPNEDIKTLVTKPTGDRERLATLHREYTYHYHKGMDQLNVIFYTLFVKFNPDNFTDRFIREYFEQEFSIEGMLSELFKQMIVFMPNKSERNNAIVTFYTMLSYYMNYLEKNKYEREVWEKTKIGFVITYNKITKRQFDNLVRARDYIFNYCTANQIFEQSDIKTPPMTQDIVKKVTDKFFEHDFPWPIRVVAGIADDDSEIIIGANSIGADEHAEIIAILNLLDKHAEKFKREDIKNKLRQIRKIISNRKLTDTEIDELNMIAQSLGNPFEGKTIYVTLEPCDECLPKLYALGFSEIKYLVDDPRIDSPAILTELASAKGGSAIRSAPYQERIADELKKELNRYINIRHKKGYKELRDLIRDTYLTITENYPELLIYMKRQVNEVLYSRLITDDYTQIYAELKEKLKIESLMTEKVKMETEKEQIFDTIKIEFDREEIVDSVCWDLVTSVFASLKNDYYGFVRDLKSNGKPYFIKAQYLRNVIDAPTLKARKKAIGDLKHHMTVALWSAGSLSKTKSIDSATKLIGDLKSSYPGYGDECQVNELSSFLSDFYWNFNFYRMLITESEGIPAINDACQMLVLKSRLLNLGRFEKLFNDLNAAYSPEEFLKGAFIIALTETLTSNEAPSEARNLFKYILDQIQDVSDLSGLYNLFTPSFTRFDDYIKSMKLSEMIFNNICDSFDQVDGVKENRNNIFVASKTIKELNPVVSFFIDDELKQDIRYDLFIKKALDIERNMGVTVKIVSDMRNANIILAYEGNTYKGYDDKKVFCLSRELNTFVKQTVSFDLFLIHTISNFIDKDYLLRIDLSESKLLDKVADGKGYTLKPEIIKHINSDLLKDLLDTIREQINLIEIERYNIKPKKIFTPANSALFDSAA